MPLTLQQYADYLDTRGTAWPAPPQIEKPKAKPHLVPLPGLRVVAWSVYGTLLGISGGDLLFEHPQQFIMDLALDKTLQEFKMWGSMTRKPGQPSEYLGQMYRKVLDELRTVPGSVEKYPEIPAEWVWEGVIKKLMQKEYQWDVGFFGSLNEYSRKVAYFFHNSLQGTACYPGAAEILSYIRDTGLLQGIVSNGQVFTLIQLERGLRTQQPQCNTGRLFDPALCVFSFQLRARKPSERLYRQLLDEIRRQGITPNQVLHVGSSIPLDVIPAKRLGLRTALFAGDKASLEATSEQLKSPSSRPDVLLTELEQLRRVLQA